LQFDGELVQENPDFGHKNGNFAGEEGHGRLFILVKKRKDLGVQVE
jgi:hypothetical protein